MPRTIIDIPAQQLREVDRLCARLSISRAEAVRRGLKQFIEHNTEVTTNGFGLWGGTGERDALLGDQRSTP
jgi:metal-responsive CopG/Arc/MetJ family transcriptional regulator